jgi:SAM-dependent methyltransferase
LSDFDFQEIDIELAPAVPGGPYDVVFSRMLLPHVEDPAQVVRKLFDAVAPGGVLILQEFDVRSWEVQPQFDGSDLPRRILVDTWLASGKDPRLACELPLMLRAAGATGAVNLRGNSWLSSQGADGAKELLGAMGVFLPSALAAMIVDQRELRRFERDLREHYRTNPWSYQLSPTLMSSWTRK